LITVNPINDAPAFTPGTDILVLEDSGAYNAPWATAITAGPGDESGQVLTFLVSNDNNALFAAQPAIDASGNLTFTPVAGASGNAVVSVVLQDDGGTANGGVDSSPAQYFTITVQAVNSAPTISASAGICLSDSKPNGTFNLAVGDAQSPAESLTVTATSDNQSLLPDANLNLTGSGSSRSLTLLATPRKSGTAVISVLVSDGTNSTTLPITLIVGTSQNETLNGTSGVDALFGLGGTNTLNGLAGNDLLCGGTKTDTLNGGDGDDVLDGGKGNDVLNGGNDNDTLLGNAGNDGLTGGSGADSFNGGAGRDSATDLNAAEGDILIGTIP
jgi:Ca2+-binding RTX toxin-like protein